MPRFNRQYAIVQPRGRNPLHLRSNCHGLFQRMKACVLPSARMNIAWTAASLRADKMLRSAELGVDPARFRCRVPCHRCRVAGFDSAP